MNSNNQLKKLSTIFSIMSEDSLSLLSLDILVMEIAVSSSALREKKAVLFFNLSALPYQLQPRGQEGDVGQKKRIISWFNVKDSGMFNVPCPLGLFYKIWCLAVNYR